MPQRDLMRRGLQVCLTAEVFSLLLVSAVLNGPPMSVKKEREAEMFVHRREQRSGEVICIDD